MSRISFKTGKSHQEVTAIWARQRLADKRGRCFTHPNDQDGVLFADGVGLGKTWEALSAAALVLYKKMQPKRGRRHVIILCPANLVTKWEDELSAGSPFRERLTSWARSRAASARRVMDTLTHVLPIRSSKHVRTRLKRGRFHPPGGTYIVSQSLITGKRRGLSALRREDWDVVIVDEAHNAAARKALASLQSRRRAPTKFLLTATPFQLEPHQFNRLARNVLIRSYKVLNHREIASYIEQLSRVFESPREISGPTRTNVNAVSEILRKIAARSVPRTSNRRYCLMMLDGKEKPISARLDELDEGAVHEFFEKLRRDNKQDLDFEAVYFEQRLRLASNYKPYKHNYIATSLRRMLARGTHAHESPRLRALGKWARRNFERDLRLAIETGLPRKTLVFTSFVGKGSQGEAALLKKRLLKSFGMALSPIRRRYGHRWYRWRAAGKARIEHSATSAKEVIAGAIRGLSKDEITVVMAGKHRQFLSRLRRTLEKIDDEVREARNEIDKLQDRRSIEGRALQRRLNDMKDKQTALSSGLGAVERYTGSERRSRRDRVATAFREIGPPWVLVASNVGSEGIDLHTYTARIVHYDLEWNPAKMEQREGRGDRVGRCLNDKLDILYCLVPRTYDERMFHQLVARDRWHGVLLGKPGSKWDDEEWVVPLVDRQKLRRMRLDLRPRNK